MMHPLLPLQALRASRVSLTQPRSSALSLDDQCARLRQSLVVDDFSIIGPCESWRHAQIAKAAACVAGCLKHTHARVRACVPAPRDMELGQYS